MVRDISIPRQVQFQFLDDCSSMLENDQEWRKVEEIPRDVKDNNQRDSEVRTKEVKTKVWIPNGKLDGSLPHSHMFLLPQDLHFIILTTILFFLHFRNHFYISLKL